jgi:hypothetical protein
MFLEEAIAEDAPADYTLLKEHSLGSITDIAINMLFHLSSLRHSVKNEKRIRLWR